MFTILLLDGFLDRPQSRRQVFDQIILSHPVIKCATVVTTPKVCQSASPKATSLLIIVLELGIA